MSANPIITNTGILFACLLMCATILVTQYFRLQFKERIISDQDRPEL
jgi:hypothetical protein